MKRMKDEITDFESQEKTTILTSDLIAQSHDLTSQGSKLEWNYVQRPPSSIKYDDDEDDKYEESIVRWETWATRAMPETFPGVK